jgi:hypothetical protein
MPWYYFHVYDGERRIEEDRCGLELADVAEAQEKYTRIIKATLSEKEWTGELKDSREFRVLDEHGHAILRVPFGPKPENRDGTISDPIKFVELRRIGRR